MLINFGITATSSFKWNFLLQFQQTVIISMYIPVIHFLFLYRHFLGKSATKVPYLENISMPSVIHNRSHILRYQHKDNNKARLGAIQLVKCWSFFIYIAEINLGIIKSTNFICAVKSLAILYSFGLIHVCISNRISSDNSLILTSIVSSVTCLISVWQRGKVSRTKLKRCTNVDNLHIWR